MCVCFTVYITEKRWNLHTDKFHNKYHQFMLLTTRNYSFKNVACLSNVVQIQLREEQEEEMVIVRCPVIGCCYKTEDVSEIVVVELLQLHSTQHHNSCSITCASNDDPQTQHRIKSCCCQQTRASNVESQNFCRSQVLYVPPNWKISLSRGF